MPTCNFFAGGFWLVLAVSLKAGPSDPSKRDFKMSISGGYAAVIVEVNLNTLAQIDALKAKWGLRNRGSVVNRLLEEILVVSNSTDDNPSS